MWNKPSLQPILYLWDFSLVFGFNGHISEVSGICQAVLQPTIVCVASVLFVLF